MRRRRRGLAAPIIVVALTLLSACGSDDASVTTVTDGWDSPTAGVAAGAPSITAPDGDPPTELQITDLETGDGTAAATGDLVVVNYIGALFDNGVVFDSSFDRAPFSVTLGQGNVIAGWDEGIVGMKPGGTRQLIIPPDMAYGSQARGNIPADSTLIFNVTLNTVLTRPTDIAPVEGGTVDELRTTDLVVGDGEEATATSEVSLHYEAVHGSDATTFDSSFERGQSFDVTLGQHQVIEGFEQGIVGMRVGGRRRIEIPAALGYGDTGAGTAVAPGETLVFIVDLVAVN
ncbi:MAG: FKBP-type peptidyl-prolyl cis-trans isomerase [Microthrixaceae bacterium]|nr:FKBP-type peptidyl-prolyl cis-trans isomerase [Microthrixaceae bacterium]HPB46330.1 FKBP-type peptidyl-prolyl cis-trans isomerase [Microthrixaceae bacterium]